MENEHNPANQQHPPSDASAAPDNGQSPPSPDQQSDLGSGTRKSKRHKGLLITILVGIILLIVVGAIAIFVNISTSHESNTQAPGFAPDVNYPEEISASEKQMVSQKVIAELELKYGKGPTFTVSGMKKGKLHIGDVGGLQKYFTINMHMRSSEIETDFTVNYVNRTDNIWFAIQQKYQSTILSEFKAVNTHINAVSYSLSDYDGFLGDKDNDFDSLDTVVGHMPTVQDMKQLVQSIKIQLEGVGSSGGAKEFVAAQKPEVKKLYAYITQNYPRIPKGTGVTSVEIDFGNDVTITIAPLAKQILVRANSNNQGNITYQWSELVE